MCATDGGATARNLDNRGYVGFTQLPPPPPARNKWARPGHPFERATEPYNRCAAPRCVSREACVVDLSRITKKVAGKLRHCSYLR